MSLKGIRELNKFFVFLLLIIIMVTVLGKNVDFYYSEGVTSFNAGNYQKAEKYLKMTLLLQPSIENTSNIKYMIGLSALYAGDLVTARAYLPGKDFQRTNNASINQASRHNLLKDIAQWETMSNPINKDNTKRETLPSWVALLLFFSILSIIMLASFLYKHKDIRKTFRTSTTKIIGSEATPEDVEILVKNMPINILEETPSDMPSEEEIKARLKSLLGKNKDSQKENTSTINEPEKIIQSVNDDASDDELLDLTKAVQEILSKESENSRT